MSKKKPATLTAWLVRDATGDKCRTVHYRRPTGKVDGKFTDGKNMDRSERRTELDKLLQKAGFAIRAGAAPVELVLSVKA